MAAILDEADEGHPRAESHFGRERDRAVFEEFERVSAVFQRICFRVDRCAEPMQLGVAHAQFQ